MVTTEEKRALGYVSGGFEGFQGYYGEGMRRAYAALEASDKARLKAIVGAGSPIDLDSLMADTSLLIPSVVITKISGNLGASLVHMNVPEEDITYWAQLAAKNRAFAPGNTRLTALLWIYLEALKENDAEIERRRQQAVPA